jgi:hypothetical protein
VVPAQAPTLPPLPKVQMAQAPFELHTGAAVLLPLHSVLPVAIGLCVQARQLSLVESQMGVVLEQLVLAVHCTQAPDSAPVVAHTGVVGCAVMHSVVPLLQARQVCVARLQKGVVPEQLASAVHCTQLFEPVSHTGVPPTHSAWLVAVHCTQVPAPELQAGVVALLAEHWPSAVQAAQLPVAPQIGVPPAHCELAVQLTHWPFVPPAIEHKGLPYVVMHSVGF